MMSTHIIGIDPGKNGGVARVIFTDKYIWTAYKCPKNIKEMAELIKIFKKFAIKPKCFLENVHAFPTDGRSSAFKFGTNFGMWQGILAALNIETELVTPQSWQKDLELSKVKKERKNELKKIATDVSGIKATLNTADAICITNWGLQNV